MRMMYKKKKFLQKIISSPTDGRDYSAKVRYKHFSRDVDFSAKHLHTFPVNNKTHCPTTITVSFSKCL